MDSRFFNSDPHARAVSGFTLVELMVCSAITTIILAGVVTCYLSSIKGFRAIANYAEIHGDGRIAVDYFARDVRSTSAITTYATTNLTITIPTAFNSFGTAIS